MRDIILVLIASFLLFVLAATCVPNASFVGSIGGIVGFWNYKIFGVLAYIYPLLLGFGLLKLHKNFEVKSLKFALNVAGVGLMMVSFLMMFSMFSLSSGGLVGAFFVKFLRQVVGSIGTGVITLALFLVAFLLLYGEFPRVKKLGILPQLNAFFLSLANQIRLKFAKKPATLALNEHKKLAKPVVKQKTLFDEEQFEAQHAPQNAPFESPKPSFSRTKLEEIDAQNIAILDDFADKNATAPDPLAATKPNLPSRQITKTEFDEAEFENAEFEEAQTAEENVAKTAKNSVEIVQEIKENTELLNQIERGKTQEVKDFVLPSLDFLATPPSNKKAVDENEIDSKIANLLEKLRRFKIDGDVVRTYSGPVVTTFEFKPAANVKVSRILTLQDDLAMALKAQTIRLQAPVPGKDVVGIEIPNAAIETIFLREILESEVFTTAKSSLTIALGKDIVGNAFVTDLKKLPHLLIAGTTGSGKSVGINSMLLSLLYRNSPKTLRLIMIDPKMLEFSVYNDIPHLLTPVITEPKKAIVVLANLVGEMERRYKLMSKTKTKNIETFNEKMRTTGGETLPFIVVIIDELADLMMTSGKEVEFHIGRLAQMARASGIHLIVATQRPSVDVVTGLIKANLPSRISYRVGQKIDSKVIIDQMGAESLLGRGDMLFTPPGSPGVVRLHAPFASEEEIERIVEFLKDQEEVCYDESYLYGSESGLEGGEFDGEIGEVDELFEEAKRIVLEEEKTSISYLQRRLKIGYNRSATIIEQLANAGILSEVNAKGQREILRK